MIQGMGIIYRPTHTQEDSVESDLSTLNCLARVVLLLTSSLRLILRSTQCGGGVGGLFGLAGQGVTKIASGRHVLLLLSCPRDRLVDGGTQTLLSVG
eukprot:1160574-Pelagomonas_calceolata.AAC.1